MANERYLRLEREDTYGVEITSPSWKYIDIFNESITPDNQPIFPDSAMFRAKRRYAAGPFKTGGSIEYAMDPMTSGWFLTGILGDPATTQPDMTNSPTVYQHVFDDPDTVGSFSLGIGTGIANAERMYSGTILNNGTIEATAGEVITLSVDTFARMEKLQALQTPTTGTDEPLLVYHMGKVELDDTTTSVESFSLTINENITDDSYELGSRFLEAIYVQELEITGSLDMPFISPDIYKKFFGSETATEPQTTLTPVKIELLCDTGVAIDTTYNYKMDILIPRCILKTTGASVSGRERVKQPIEFQALYDTTNSCSVKITLINIQTSYDSGTAQG